MSESGVSHPTIRYYDALASEVRQTRRGLDAGRWPSAEAMLTQRAGSALNQMAAAGVLPLTQVKLEAALIVVRELANERENEDA